MFDYINCKSVRPHYLCQYLFRKEVPCQYFHSGDGGGERIPVLKNIQKNERIYQISIIQDYVISFSYRSHF